MNFLIVIPAFNEENYLKFTLDSLLNQSPGLKNFINSFSPTSLKINSSIHVVGDSDKSILFKDLKPLVLKEDGYWNPLGTRRITIQLIKEMIEYIKIIYNPSNLEELKQQLYDHITTKYGKIFVDGSNFDDIIQYHYSMTLSLGLKDRNQLFRLS